MNALKNFFQWVWRELNLTDLQLLDQRVGVDEDQGDALDLEKIIEHGSLYQQTHHHHHSH